jgi:hypothetical protein
MVVLLAVIPAGRESRESRNPEVRRAAISMRMDSGFARLRARLGMTS